MAILVIDVGGTHIKLKLQGGDEVRKRLSGPSMTPQKMIELVQSATEDWKFNRVSIGYPGPVIDGVIQREPINLAEGWMGFDFASALGCPVKLINDAAMQALGSYEGGRMLFLGLGTGLGTTLIINGFMVPMELGHLPYKKGLTYEHYVGQAGMKRLGRNKWIQLVFDVVARLRAAFLADYVVLGGGNVKKLDELPPACRMGDNRNAFLGGFRLWDKNGIVQ
ncbi:MAG TPA: ROK family protein [Gemmataceae bacterium]|nr:ROK family protein [Gemmataceae bacterium]